jgi:glycerophosphoryl diester phosphodiesterase
MLSAAATDGADLLELDVRYHDGVWRVEHNDWGGSSAARLSDVVDAPALHPLDQPLFIEIKERDPTETALRELLDSLFDNDLAINGRPIVFRAFDDERLENLAILRSILDSGDYPFQEPYVRLHVLFDEDSADETTEFHSKIQEANESGYNGVEFNLHTADLANLLAYSSSIGLGSAIWTVPESMGEVWCAAMREDVDALIVDYDISQCRIVAEEDTGLLYMNTSTLGTDLEVPWYRSGDGEDYTTLGAPDLPGSITRTYGSGLYGTSLIFDKTRFEAMSLYDADSEPTGGYFLMVTLEFDDLDLGSDDVQAIFSKADSGGFALEVVDGFFGPKLRFGVHVDGSYHYAEKSLSGLDTRLSHTIMGAYDGDGRVRLWLNHSDDGVDESSTLLGGVTSNDSPVTLGADPEGPEDTRFHFSGRIQTAMLQQWRDH